jgi:hypothetical protein
MDDIPKSPRSRVILIIDILEDEGRWLVRLCRNIYSEHANQHLAQREAFELAEDARKLGHDVEVWGRAAKTKRLL